MADESGWISLSTAAKAKCYEHWTNDPTIGGVLTRYLDKGQVRVYIKDTLLKGYARSKLADECLPLRVLRLPAGIETVETYVKPHGRRLADGRIISWGRALDWKAVIMAVHERAYLAKGARPYAAILTYALGRFGEDTTRAMVAEAANKLGIEQLIWLDT